MAVPGGRKRTVVERGVFRQFWRLLSISVLTIGTTILLYLTRGPQESSLRPVLHFLYLLPIGMMAHFFGLGWGMGLGLLCASLFIPVAGQRVATEGLSADTVEMLVAIVLYIALAYIVGSLAEARRRQERLQETLNLLGAVLDQSFSLPDLLPVVLSNSMGLLGAERGEIFLREERSGRLERAAQIGFPSVEETDPVAELSPEAESLPEWLLEQGRPFLSNDLHEDPRFAQAEGERGVGPRSVVAAPLYRGPQPFGLLVLEDHPRGFREEDMRLLEAVAEKCGIAIENARLYGELHAFSRELEERVRERTAELAREFQQREAILHSIADGVVVADREGQLLLFNPVAAEILPCLTEENLGRPLSELAQSLGENGTRREVLEHMRELLVAPGDLRSSYSAPALRFTVGVQTWVALYAPVIGSPGEVEGIVAILHDITQEIEAINARTQFVSAVAHDLRVPLTSIRGYSDLLLMGTSGPLTEQQRSQMGTIQRNAERMATLVRDLLDLCRLESGRVQVEIGPTSLRSAVEEVTTLMLPQLQEKDLALEVRLPPHLPLVLADPHRLNQVLTNLVGNAQRYTPAGGSIGIAARSLPPPQSDPRRYPEEEAPYVEVAVQDTGIGVPPEDHERIFERFVRLDHPLVEQAGGTGLGLTIVRQLLHLQGGRIWLESAVGQGSTFYFSLPVAE